MLKMANDSNWDELVDIEEQRRNLIHDFFSSPAEIEDVPEITEGTKNILDIDRQIMEMSKNHRDELGTQLSDMKQGSRVSKAYMQNSD